MECERSMPPQPWKPTPPIRNRKVCRFYGWNETHLGCSRGGVVLSRWGGSSDLLHSTKRESWIWNGIDTDTFWPSDVVGIGSDVEVEIWYLRHLAWLPKQVACVCTTWVNITRIQDLWYDKYTNCRLVHKTSSHLNRCPEDSRPKLFRQSMELLENWLHQDNQTEPKLAFWIPKYLLFRAATI